MPLSSQLDLNAEVDAVRHRRPTVALAVGIVRDGALDQITVRGPADIDSGEPATPDTAFRIASITKTLTALAIMRLREQGRIDLDAPVADYLRGFRLTGPRADSPPPTVRQLLTHTAGLPEALSLTSALRPDFGESVAGGEPVPTLGEFYGGDLRAVADPGTVFTYTNHGPATLGQIVEDVSGQPLGDYLGEHVFGPWSMASTDLLQSRRPAGGRATGYRLTGRGPAPVPVRDMVTAGAAAAWSTPADLCRYAAALLGGGANEHGRALAPRTVAEMFGPHYRPDPRLPGMGLGFFRGEVGGHPVVEHQGIIPGFDSHVVLAPDDGVGVVAVATGARLAMFWLPVETSRLLGRILGADGDGVRDGLAQRPEVWPELCGVYSVPAPLTDIRMRSIVGAGVQVLVRRGRLVLRCLHPMPTLRRGVALHPETAEDPYLFRFDLSDAGLGSSRVAFAPDPRTGRMAMHLEIMPLTAYRRGRATFSRPRA